MISDELKKIQENKVDQSESELLRDKFEHHWREFSTFRTHCSEVASLCYNEADDFYETYNASSKGEKKNLKIYDDTAAQSLTTFSAVMESLNVPSSERWHRTQPARVDLRRNKKIQKYYDSLTEALFIHRYNPRANFQGQMAIGYSSLGAFGNKIIFTDKRAEGGVRYKACFMGDMCWDVNHQGLPNQSFRRFDYSNQQIFEAVTTGVWKGGNLPSEVMGELTAIKPEWNKRHEYIHVVLPNNQLEHGKKDFRGMAFASFYIHRNTGEVVHRSGYRTNPYAISRYAQSPHENMGRGPLMRVFNEVRTLNEMAKDQLSISHLAVHPALLIHDDGIVSSGGSQFDLRPGGQNFGAVSREGRPLVHPLNSGTQPILNEQLMEIKRNTIEKAMLVDVFNRVSDKDARMTAQEALLRDREKSGLVGPIMGREQTEGLTPMIEREIDILEAQGFLPEKPQELIDALREHPSAGDFDVVHESPIMQLQKSGAQIAVDKVTNKALELAQYDEGEAVGMLDSEFILLHTIESSGAPYGMLKSEDQIQQENEAKAQQQQASQLQEMAPAMSDTVLNLAKAQEITGG